MNEVERVHRVLASDSRAALLEELRHAGRPLSASEAAEAVGLHPSTARMHLDMLVSAGLADRAVERRATVGRPIVRYTTRPPGQEPGGAAAGDDYMRLAGVLADGLSNAADPAGAAREAGRRWTEALAVEGAGRVGPDEAIDRVVALMDDLGFEPDQPADVDRIELHRCPFESVAREHRTVVCGVHLGMLEETFARLGGTVEVAALQPFASERPLRCVVDLRRSSTAKPGRSEDHGAGARRRARRHPRTGATRG